MSRRIYHCPSPDSDPLAASIAAAIKARVVSTSIPWFSASLSARATAPSVSTALSIASSTPFDMALIAGSGIHEAVQHYPETLSISYADLPGMPVSGVQGHKSSLSVLRIAEKNVLLFRGRFHRYEGYDLSTTVLPIRICAALGIPSVIVTNAAGGLNPQFRSGDIMMCDALLNFSFAEVGVVPKAQAMKKNLLRAPVEQQSPTWQDRVSQELAAQDWLRRGCYVSVSGPSYETKAEIRMFTTFADAIGMSTIHEVQAARSLGLRTLVFSVISNVLHGEVAAKLEHTEVLETARAAASRIATVVETACLNAKGRHAR